MPDLLYHSLLLAGSLILLIKGSDWFIDAAQKIGLSAGVSPFIIGLTVVAFGTSLPELASGITSVRSGDSAVVAGIVIGSNITNILLVLGIVAVVGKVVQMDYDIMDIDMPLLVGSAFLLWFCLSDGHFSRFEAILFLLGLVVFILNSVAGNIAVDSKRPPWKWSYLGFLVMGGVLVKYGADFTIVSMKHLGEDLSIPPDILAQTLLALGTSLPEVTVSIMAALRGQSAIAVGNVLGSNVFNTYAVMAIPSFFGRLEFSSDISAFALPFMVAATILFSVIAIGGRITRWEGHMLLIFYLFYLGVSFGFAAW